MKKLKLIVLLMAVSITNPIFAGGVPDPKDPRVILFSLYLGIASVITYPHRLVTGTANDFKQKQQREKLLNIISNKKSQISDCESLDKSSQAGSKYPALLPKNNCSEYFFNTSPISICDEVTVDDKKDCELIHSTRELCKTLEKEKPQNKSLYLRRKFFHRGPRLNIKYYSDYHSSYYNINCTYIDDYKLQDDYFSKQPKEDLLRSFVFDNSIYGDFPVEYDVDIHACDKIAEKRLQIVCKKHFMKLKQDLEAREKMF